MQLILWRHAQAEEGDDDLVRSLTAKGHKQARKMARFFAREIVGRLSRLDIGSRAKPADGGLFATSCKSAGCFESRCGSAAGG